MKAPRLGEAVLVVGSHARANGADVAPGLITRVGEEQPDGGWLVNVTVFPDARTPGPVMRIRLCGTEEQARGCSPSTACWRPRGEPAPGTAKDKRRST